MKKRTSFDTLINLYMGRLKKVRILFVGIFFILLQTLVNGQNTVQNPGFDLFTPGKNLPVPWFKWGSDNFQLSLDSTHYKSGKYAIRIEPVTTIPRPNSFGCITQVIKAPYKGKKLTLKAWMKYENIENGLVRLLLQIANPEDKRVKDQMEDLNLQGTSDWKEYSVTVPYPKDATSIYFGALNSGSGKLWVDNFQLYLDGKNLNQYELEALNTPPTKDARQIAKTKTISASHPLAVEDKEAREYAVWKCQQLNRLPAQQIKAHPAATTFPGEVTSSAPRITRKVQLHHTPVPQNIRHITDNLHYSGPGNLTLYSTGLYAAPGEVITVEIPEHLKGKVIMQIGCHTDNLNQKWSASRKEAWRRMPLIVRRDLLNQKVSQTASAFGGLIYLACSPYTPACEGEITIRNGVEAPHFILGQTTDAEWREMVIHTGAPWGEIEGNDIILTFSTQSLKKITSPTQLAPMWDNITNACYDLAQIPVPFFRKQRIVTDVHITGGYLHSGYPIMAHHCPSRGMICEDILTRAEQLLQPTSKFSGWGFFHEIGHNMQNAKDWVFNGSTEVSVNFFSLYIFDHIMQGRDYAHEGISGAKTQKMMKIYFANGAKFTDWQKNPFLGLVMFRQIQTAFGWETFKKVFRRFHEENAKTNNPRFTDQEKIDHFMTYLSDATGRNLMPFFKTWGIPVSEKCAEAVNPYPQWMPYNFPPKK